MEYSELTDWRRSTGYVVDDGDTQLCDRDLVPGWYRAVTPAGGDMPTSAPGYHHCGTAFPIYLLGNTQVAIDVGFVYPLFFIAVKHIYEKSMPNTLRQPITLLSSLKISLCAKN